jgi:hypothetical protein
MSGAYQFDDPNVRVRSSGTGPVRIARYALPLSVFGGGSYKTALLATDLFAEYEAYNVPGWDGYDAEPVTNETVDTARRFRRLLPRALRAPDIAPGADGTIGFEWRHGPRNHYKLIFVEIGPGDRVAARIVHEDGRIISFPSTQLGTGAKKLISDLFS